MCSDSNARDDNSLHLKPSDRAQQNACVVYFVIPPFTVDVSLHPSGYVGSLDGGRQEEGLPTQEFVERGVYRFLSIVHLDIAL